MALLLSAGASVEATGEEGFTPLMKAALWGFGAVVKRLLDAGADSEVENDGGETAFSIAKNFRHDDVAAMLLKHKRQRWQR